MSGRSHRITSERLLTLVEQINEAALDPSQWPRFLTTLADALGAESGALVVTGAQSSQGTFAVSARLDPDAGSEYAKHFSDVDPWAAVARRMGFFRTGFAHHAEGILSHPDFAKTEFYSDFGRRFGIVRGACGVIRSDATHVAAISLYSSEARHRFEDRDTEVIRRLLPHLRRALTIDQLVVPSRQARSALTDTLSLLACGALLADARGDVIFINRTAQDILAQSDGLMIRGKRLAAATTETHARLTKLLSADSQPASAGDELGGTVAVSRPSGRRAFLVLVAPAGQIDPMLAPAVQPLRIVLIHDPERQVIEPAAHLRAHFGPAAPRRAWRWPSWTASGWTSSPTAYASASIPPGRTSSGCLPRRARTARRSCYACSWLHSRLFGPRSHFGLTVP